MLAWHAQIQDTLGQFADEARTLVKILPAPSLWPFKREVGRLDDPFVSQPHQMTDNVVRGVFC